MTQQFSYSSPSGLSILLLEQEIAPEFVVTLWRLLTQADPKSST